MSIDVGVTFHSKDRETSLITHITMYLDVELRNTLTNLVDLVTGKWGNILNKLLKYFHFYLYCIDAPLK